MKYWKKFKFNTDESIEMEVYSTDLRVSITYKLNPGESLGEIDKVITGAYTELIYEIKEYLANLDNKVNN